MSKEVLIILLGLLIALMPYLGFPGSWKNVLSIVIGIAIAGLGFVVRQERIWKEREEIPERREDSFVENGGIHSRST
jgi:asparagine N-glycosylation enzyme membrane subunit Stt3